MFCGKNKAITFSYDDGVTQDIRLAEVFNKYGMKCTFNINSGLLGSKHELVRNGVTVSHNKSKYNASAEIALIEDSLYFSTIISDAF